MSKVVLELPDEALSFVKIEVYIDPKPLFSPSSDSNIPYTRVVCLPDVVPGDYITAKIER